MTPGEVKAIKAGKDYKRFVESGDNDMAERYILHGYILTTMGIYMIEEANELMRKHGLMHRGLKLTCNDFSGAFDKHNRIMKTFFPGLPEKIVFAEAIDKVRPSIDALVSSGVLEAIKETKQPIEKIEN